MSKTISRQDVENALEAAYIYEDGAIRESYEGRFHAREGFGIVIENMARAFSFFTALGVTGAENDESDEDDLFTSQDAYELSGNAQMDNMGLSTIVYFPGWTLT